MVRQFRKYSTALLRESYGGTIEGQLPFATCRFNIRRNRAKQGLPHFVRTKLGQFALRRMVEVVRGELGFPVDVLLIKLNPGCLSTIVIFSPQPCVRFCTFDV